MTTITHADNRAAKTTHASANDRGYFVPQVNIVETKDSQGVILRVQRS